MSSSRGLQTPLSGGGPRRIVRIHRIPPGSAPPTAASSSKGKMPVQQEDTYHEDDLYEDENTDDVLNKSLADETEDVLQFERTTRPNRRASDSGIERRQSFVRGGSHPVFNRSAIDNDTSVFLQPSHTSEKIKHDPTFPRFAGRWPTYYG
ncbi:hypothetical protein FQN50_005952 [Emmonsiellopsis sp. PD_5]|nr:hypothetical protein FQN50_005952 [Emmonsiellopsis sp. PD_5]